jgi:hypothetical protein
MSGEIIVRIRTMKQIGLKITSEISMFHRIIVARPTPLPSAASALAIVPQVHAISTLSCCLQLRRCDLVVGGSIIVAMEMIAGRRSRCCRLAVSRLTISWLAIASLTVLCFGSTAHHRGIGEARVVAWSVTGRAGSGGQLGIPRSVLVAAIPLPEWCFARAGGIVVRWGGTIALFFLVVADQEDLKDSRDDEEEAEMLISQE